MALLNPISGPITPEQLQELADAPAGVALRELRKHDPMFGRAEGEKIAWCASFTGTIYGEATVKADSLENAKKLANNLTAGQIEWEDSFYAHVEDVTLASVLPDA